MPRSRRDRRDMRSRIRRDMGRARRLDMASRRLRDRARRDRERADRDMEYEMDERRRDRRGDRRRDREYPISMKNNMGYDDYNYRNDRGDYRGDYGYDYDDGEEYLDEEELMDWADDLMEEIDPKDKPFFTKENVHQKAQMMNIQFDKFTPEEFYVTTLMQYTDYKDALGTANPEIYVAMAKLWLNDKDAEKKQGEKLATYYDEIVCGGK